MKTLLSVKGLFEDEYSFLLDAFDTFELSVWDAMNNGEEKINSPGVYVFWHPSHGVIKVGKSQSNSKKRALQHIRDNTHNNSFEMSSLEGDLNARLLLFNIKDHKCMHWILSLEAFMEWNSSPVIAAGRMG